ncbi:MAG TPA: hypothetical protein VF384_00385 [Planctomycetota bacterium]
MDPAATTTSLRDEVALLGASAFFLAIACLLGFVVYRLLSRPADRRPGFRTWGAWRKGTSALAGAALAAAVFTAFVATSIAGFHRVVVSDSEVLLGYMPPFDGVSLRRTDLKQVRCEPGIGAGASRLVIETRDGSRYESVPARIDVLKAVHAQIARDR